MSLIAVIVWSAANAFLSCFVVYLAIKVSTIEARAEAMEQRLAELERWRWDEPSDN